MRVSKEVPDIGPSILHSKVRFEKNIKVLLRTEGAKWQRKPLCNVMLDQRWFNGVGNYIRSEVIYKSGFKPCDDAFEILSDKYKLKRLIDELHEVNNKYAKFIYLTNLVNDRYIVTLCSNI